MSNYIDIIVLLKKKNQKYIPCNVEIIHTISMSFLLLKMFILRSFNQIEI